MKIWAHVLPIFALFLWLNTAKANLTPLSKDIALEQTIPYMAVTSVQIFTADIREYSQAHPQHPNQIIASNANKICRYFGYENAITYKTHKIFNSTILSLHYNDDEKTVEPYPDGIVQGWKVTLNGERVPTNLFLAGKASCNISDCDIERPWLPNEVFLQLECFGYKEVIAIRDQIRFLKTNELLDRIEFLMPLFLEASRWAEKEVGRNPIDYVVRFLKDDLKGSRLDPDQAKSHE